MNGASTAATLSARSQAGVWPRPVGKMKPSAKTIPPIVVNTTVSHAATGRSIGPIVVSWAASDNMTADQNMPTP